MRALSRLSDYFRAANMCEAKLKRVLDTYFLLFSRECVIGVLCDMCDPYGDGFLAEIRAISN